MEEIIKELMDTLVGKYNDTARRGREALAEGQLAAEAGDYEGVGRAAEKFTRAAMEAAEAVDGINEVQAAALQNGIIVNVLPLPPAGAPEWN